MVSAVAINQTNGVFRSQCIVDANAPYDHIGIDVTRLRETLQPIGTGEGYRSSTREGIGSLESTGVGVKRTDAINALVRDVVAAKPRNGVAQRATHARNAQVRATTESE